jgi:putative membrane protein
MARLSESDHRRIADAIAGAEKRTSGEIFAVLTEASDDYFFVAGFMAACGVLVAAVIAALLSHWLWISIPLPLFGLAILAAFAVALLVFHFAPAVRMPFVPHAMRYRRAHQNAAQQFLALNVHATKERTGVLIFVSLAERYAEVLADSGIDAKVAQVEWNGIVALLVGHASRGNLADGFVGAIEGAVALLATHFPRRPDDVNELGDRLVEL